MNTNHTLRNRTNKRAGRMAILAFGIALCLSTGDALARGYYHGVPTGWRAVRYAGYACRYVNGVYYRAATYQGQTVWIIVN